jgi:legumain
MNTRLSLVFLAVCLGVALSDDKPKQWVLLVAGSNTWGNYRHQSDVYHAYQIVRSHGIPDETIIVMHYDDIANNRQNPTPNIVINQPNGPDNYHDVPKDYTGKNVTAKNFISILTGDKKGIQGIGSERVVESGPNDHVFVYYTDHGATGILAFPVGPSLTVKQLTDATNKMHSENRYKRLVYYVEACESGSMFRNVLPDNINVFATTASDYDESSYAFYYDKDRRTYLGDEYSINWMEDSDAQNLQTETLQEQFQIVKKKTTLSHVQEYGDLKIGDLVVGEFQGRVNGNSSKSTSTRREAGVSQWDVPLDVLYRQLVDANPAQKQFLQNQIEHMIEQRTFLESVIRKFVSRVASSQQQFDSLMATKPTSLTNLQCHDDLVHAFHNTCFDFSQHPYALKFAYILANICESGLSGTAAIRAMQQTCAGLHLSGRID